MPQAVWRLKAEYSDTLRKTVRKWQRAVKTKRAELIEALDGKKKAFRARAHKGYQSWVRKKGQVLSVIQEKSHLCIAFLKRTHQRVLHDCTKKQAKLKALVKRACRTMRIQKAACLTSFKRLAKRIRLGLKQIKRAFFEKRKHSLSLYCQKREQLKSVVKRTCRTIDVQITAYQACFTRSRKRMQLKVNQLEQVVFRAMQACLSFTRKTRIQLKEGLKSACLTIHAQGALSLAYFMRLQKRIDAQITACVVCFTRFPVRMRLKVKQVVFRKRNAYLSLVRKKRSQLKGLVKSGCRTIDAQLSACLAYFTRSHVRMRLKVKQVVFRKRNAYLSLVRKKQMSSRKG